MLRRDREAIGWSVGARAETGIFRMVVDEGAASNQLVGTASYLGSFGILTLVFWLIHRRRTNPKTAGDLG